MATTASNVSGLIGQDVFADGEIAIQLVASVLAASTEYSIIASDMDGVIRVWNAGARILYGYASSEIVGQPTSKLHTEEDRSRHLPRIMMEHALARGKWEGTVERVRKDGGNFTAAVVMTVRHDSEAKPIGFLVISRDITDERRLAAEREQWHYVLSVLDSAPDAMVIVNDAGEIRLTNAVTEKLFGYGRDELIGGHFEMLIPDLYRDRHSRQRAGFFAEPRAREMGAGLELLGKRKDDFEFPIEISLSPLETEEGLFAIAAIRDVTERKLFERDLQLANTKLHEASQAKDRFLASMSHELRTPLNAILGFTGTLLMGLPGPLNADQTKQLRTVQASGRHLLSLINDLLDLARIEAGKLELKLEAIGCQEFLEELVVGLRPLADAKGLELSVLAQSERFEVRSDRRALSQILINLVNNAIKFTDEGSVRLEVGQRDDNGALVTTFAVIDTGRGIKTSDQELLFAAFKQIESFGTHPYEGTGLGLYICNRLATLIDASITFESEFGNGSTFALVLSK